MASRIQVFESLPVALALLPGGCVATRVGTGDLRSRSTGGNRGRHSDDRCHGGELLQPSHFERSSFIPFPHLQKGPKGLTSRIPKMRLVQETSQTHTCQAQVFDKSVAWTRRLCSVPAAGAPRSAKEGLFVPAFSTPRKCTSRVAKGPSLVSEPEDAIAVDSRMGSTDHQAFRREKRKRFVEFLPIGIPEVPLVELIPRRVRSATR